MGLRVDPLRLLLSMDRGPTDPFYFLLKLVQGGAMPRQAQDAMSVEKVKKLHPKIDSSHDPLAQHREPGKIIDHLAKHADPTPDKRYLPWVVGRYKKKEFRQEDHPRVSAALAAFEKNKGSLPPEHREIDRHSLHSLESTIDSFNEGRGAAREQKTGQLKRGSAETHYNSGGTTVIQPKTRAASCLLGSGTKWCTAASKGNKFLKYNRAGPLYYVHTPDNEKHAFHFKTDSFFNAKDEPVELHDVVAKYPQLKKVPVFKQQGVHSLHFAENQGEFDKMFEEGMRGPPEERAKVAKFQSTAEE